MKISSFALSGLLASAAFAAADISLPGRHYSTDATVSPSTPGTDFWIYEETSAGNLTLTNNPAQVGAVLGGYAGAPGGNIELFPTSEWQVYLDPSASGVFAMVEPVRLSGTAGGISFEFRSLNGADWFGTGTGYNTSFGAPTLATEWFNGFIDSVVSKMTNSIAAAGVNTMRAGLFDEWRDSGGFASLSDANIGYVHADAAGTELSFGLEGFLDASPRFREFLNDGGYAGFSQFVPDGIQYSEVVMMNGEAYYSFDNGTPSGVELDDEPYNSYTADFEFSEQVPEPAAVWTLILGLVPTILRRKRC